MSDIIQPAASASGHKSTPSQEVLLAKRAKHVSLDHLHVSKKMHN
jgi:hypothetical protein